MKEAPWVRIVTVYTAPGDGLPQTELFTGSACFRLIKGVLPELKGKTEGMV